MDAHERTYVAYLVLGYGAPAPLWTHRVWLDATRRLDPLLALARGPAAVRSTQTTHAGHAVTFPRLGFGPKSHARWTHRSPDTAGSDWVFVSAEVWAPHWAVCGREGTGPDVYLALARAVMPDVGFDQALLLAFHDRLASVKVRVDTSVILSDLARAMRAVLAAQARLPWEPLQELFWNGLYTPGLGRVPEIKRLGDRWKPYLIS